MTTTPNVEGKAISKYLGLVHSTRHQMRDGVDDMTRQAQELGADAVVGIIIAGGDNCADMFGTAVKLK